MHRTVIPTHVHTRRAITLDAMPSDCTSRGVGSQSRVSGKWGSTLPKKRDRIEHLDSCCAGGVGLHFAGFGNRSARFVL